MATRRKRAAEQSPESPLRKGIREAITGSFALAGLIAASFDAAWKGDMRLAAIFLLVAWILSIAGTEVAEALWHVRAGKRRLITVVTGVISGAMLLGIYLYESSQGARSAVPPRIFVDMTAHQLADKVLGMTSVEASSYLKPYKGKWMHLAGVVRDVNGPWFADGSYSIVLDDASSPASTMPGNISSLSFDKNWEERLVVMQKGSRIEANCQIRDVTGIGSLTFDHCELTSHSSPK